MPKQLPKARFDHQVGSDVYSLNQKTFLLQEYLHTWIISPRRRGQRYWNCWSTDWNVWNIVATILQVFTISFWYRMWQIVARPVYAIKIPLTCDNFRFVPFSVFFRRRCSGLCGRPWHYSHKKTWKGGSFGGSN